MDTDTRSSGLVGARRAETLEPFGEGVARRSRRLAKLARRTVLNALGGGRPETRVVFIMGSQRSGTRISLLALENAPDILTFREGARTYFDGVNLRPEDELGRLFTRCEFPVLVLKPLCDSHRAPELLERFPDARVVWIFRWYQDAVNSSSVKWSSGAAAVERLVTGRLAPDDWRRGGLTEEALDVARRLYRPGLSLHHANAILWYLRNRLILDLALFERPRVLLVKYEDLSTSPPTHFPRVFDFIGVPMKPSYLRGIHGTSVRRNAFPEIPKAVVEACESLYGEIDRRYRLDLEQGRR